MIRLTRTRVFFVLFVAVAFCWGRPAPAADAEFTARYATQLSKTFHLTETDYKFAELVAQKTNGRLKIEVYPGSEPADVMSDTIRSILEIE